MTMRSRLHDCDPPMSTNGWPKPAYLHPAPPSHSDVDGSTVACALHACRPTTSLPLVRAPSLMFPPGPWPAIGTQYRGRSCFHGLYGRASPRAISSVGGPTLAPSRARIGGRRPYLLVSLCSAACTAAESAAPGPLAAAVRLPAPRCHPSARKWTAASRSPLGAGSGKNTPVSLPLSRVARSRRVVRPASPAAAFGTGISHSCIAPPRSLA